MNRKVFCHATFTDFQTEYFVTPTFHCLSKCECSFTPLSPFFQGVKWFLSNPLWNVCFGLYRFFFSWLMLTLRMYTYIQPAQFFTCNYLSFFCGVYVLLLFSIAHLLDWFSVSLLSISLLLQGHLHLPQCNTIVIHVLRSAHMYWLLCNFSQV